MPNNQPENLSTASLAIADHRSNVVRMSNKGHLVEKKKKVSSASLILREGKLESHIE